MDLFTKPTDKPISTAKDVYKAVKYLFQNYEYKLTNTYIFDWESDFFAISKSGYSVEVEVKISQSDFKRDFTHKTGKHDLLKNHRKTAYFKRMGDNLNHGNKESDDPNSRWFLPRYSVIQRVEPAKLLPNKFFYACQEGLILPDQVPSYAGLIYTNPHSPNLEWFRIVKPAPFLHKFKKDFNSVLLSKYYFKANDVKNMLNNFIFHNGGEKLTATQREELNRILKRL